MNTRELECPVVRERSPHAGEEENASLALIRHFFLQPQDSYTLAEISSILAMPHDDVQDLFFDDIAAWLAKHGQEHRDEPRVARETVVTIGFISGSIRPRDVELALGADFLHVRPARWVTVPVSIHLPVFIADALSEYGGGRPVSSSAEQFILDHFVTLVSSECRRDSETSARRPTLEVSRVQHDSRRL